MFELAGDVAGPGEGDAGQDGANAIGAEAPRQSVRAMRRDEQQHDDQQIERRRGRQQQEREQSDGIGGRARQCQSRAELVRPDGQLAVPYQIADQSAGRELAVEDVGGEIVVRHVEDAEREKAPVGEQGSQRQECARREIGAGAITHEWCSIPLSRCEQGL